MCMVLFHVQPRGASGGAGHRPEQRGFPILFPQSCQRGRASGENTRARTHTHTHTHSALTPSHCKWMWYICQVQNNPVSANMCKMYANHCCWWVKLICNFQIFSQQRSWIVCMRVCASVTMCVRDRWNVSRRPCDLFRCQARPHVLFFATFSPSSVSFFVFPWTSPSKV